MPRGSAPRALLLDLDGTLVDTAPDMAEALIQLQRRRGIEPLDYDDIRPWVSHGAAAMVRIGFGVEDGAESYEDLKNAYLEQYESKVAEHSRVFQGMQDVLTCCREAGIPWGIVTNKPGYLTLPLMEALALNRDVACIVSGDTVARCKPDPMPLLHACMLLRMAPSDCIYVGDAERDIQSGERAGMHTIVAEWGYISDSDDPASWGAQTILREPADLLLYLKNRLTTE
jgi:2-phosphoglycolate phosphatase